MVLPRRPPRRACKTRPEVMTLLEGDRPAGRALCRACRGDQARHCLPLRKRMPLLRSAPVEWPPISGTSDWFEPEKLGGKAMTDKTVSPHSVLRRTMLVGTAGVLGGAVLRPAPVQSQTGTARRPCPTALPRRARFVGDSPLEGADLPPTKLRVLLALRENCAAKSSCVTYGQPGNCRAYSAAFCSEGRIIMREYRLMGAAWFCLGLLVLPGCAAQPTGTASQAPVPALQPSMARVWVLRQGNAPGGNGGIVPLLRSHLLDACLQRLSV